MLKQKNIARDIINYILVLLLIIQSGAFFAIINSTIPLIVFCVIIVYSAIFVWNDFNVKIDIKELLVALILILYTLLNLVITQHNSSNLYYKNALAFMIRVAGTFIVLQIVDYKKLKEVFANIMIIISTLSLVAYFYSYFINLTYDKIYLGFLQIIYRSKLRNCGIFWEPGAFQLFINIALIYVLFNDTVEKRIFKATILIITVLSTISTSGYITLMLIMIAYIFNYLQKCNIQKKILLAMPVIILIAIGIMLFLKSEAIKLKFNPNNGSFAMRMHDLQMFVKSMFDVPILGLGEGTIEEKIFYKKYSLPPVISVGLFSSVLTKGLLYTIMVTISIFCSLYKLEKKHFIILALVIGVSMLTEEFFRYPIYIVFYMINMNKGKDLYENTICRFKFKRASYSLS